MNGTKKLKRVALDSNIFIYNLEENVEFLKFTNIIFERLLSDKLKAITSIISLTEILSFPGTASREEDLIQEFILIPNLEIIDVNSEIAIETARIRRKYKFRLPDAVQLATAKAGRAQAFITNDDRLEKFKELKVIMLKKI